MTNRIASFVNTFGNDLRKGNLFCAGEELAHFVRTQFCGEQAIQSCARVLQSGVEPAILVEEGAYIRAEFNDRNPADPFDLPMYDTYNKDLATDNVREAALACRHNRFLLEEIAFSYTTDKYTLNIGWKFGKGARIVQFDYDIMSHDMTYWSDCKIAESLQDMCVNKLVRWN